MKDSQEADADEAISLQHTEDGAVDVSRTVNTSIQSDPAAENDVENHDGTLQDLLAPVVSVTLDPNSTAPIDLGNNTLLNRKKKLDSGTTPPPGQELGGSADMPFDFSADDFDFEAFTAQQLELLRASEPPGPTGNSRRETPAPMDPNDFSWMKDFRPEEEGEANDEEIFARYQEAKKAYNKKKRDRSNTDEDDIAWLKLENHHVAWMRTQRELLEAEMGADMANLNAEQQDPEAMFILDGTPPPVQKKRTLEKTLFDDDDEEDRYVKCLMRLSASLTISSSATPAPPAKKKKAATSVRKTFKALPVNNKTNDKAFKKPKKPKKISKKDHIQARNAAIYTNLNGLTTNNMFRDVENNRASAAPSIETSTKKPQALKELLASIPLEHRDEGRMDTKAIFAAARYFTPATSCRPDGKGEWTVGGLKSSLTHYQMLGTSFMRKQETQAEDTKGGIIADAMYVLDIC